MNFIQLPSSALFHLKVDTSSPRDPTAYAVARWFRLRRPCHSELVELLRFAAKARGVADAESRTASLKMTRGVLSSFS